jgi:hypothetical protein
MSQEFSEVFYTFLITSCIGLILAIGKLCYKSKCKEVDICCFKVIRDVAGEEKIDLENTNNTEGGESPRSTRI